MRGRGKEGQPLRHFRGRCLRQLTEGRGHNPHREESVAVGLVLFKGDTFLIRASSGDGGKLGGRQRACIIVALPLAFVLAVEIGRGRKIGAPGAGKIFLPDAFWDVRFDIVQFVTLHPLDRGVINFINFARNRSEQKGRIFFAIFAQGIEQQLPVARHRRDRIGDPIGGRGAEGRAKLGPAIEPAQDGERQLVVIGMALTPDAAVADDLLGAALQ